MTSRDRLLTTLHCTEPDRVPYCEFWIDPPIARRLMGWQGDEGESGFSAVQAQAVARRLHLDNILFVVRPPVFAQTGVGKDGRHFYGDGQIKSKSDLGLLQLPDPTDPALLASARAFAAAKGDYAATFVTRAGLFPTISSMGFETFSIALHEDRALVEAVFDRYCDWAVALAERAAGLGFDLFVTTDDMAFKTGPFFSPTVFRDLVVPRYRRIADKLRIPWVVHSDGNIEPFLDDLLALGVAGIHPVEKGAMDIRAVKRRVAGRLCLFGNVEMDLLGRGTPKAVEREVRELIRDVGPGGGYAVTSGNSLASYLKLENILAMSRAVQKHGRYPLPHPGASS